MHAIAAVCLLLCLHVDAKLVVVPLKNDRPFQFLGWFTYNEVTNGSRELNETTMEWTVEGRAGANAVRVIIYSDVEASYSKAQKYIEADETDEEGMSDTERCNIVSTRAGGGYPYVQHHAKLVVPGFTRPRVWHVYAASLNCNESIGEGGSVTIHFRNAGGFFSAEFGVDRQWVTETLIAAVAACAVLIVGFLVAHIRENMEQDEPLPLHPIMRHFVATCTLQMTAFIFLLCNGLKYAATGAGNEGLEVAGLVIDTLATLMLLVLIIVYAMGFKVVEVEHLANYESVQKRRKSIALFMLATMVLHGALILAQYQMDGWSTELPYATWPGYCLAGLRVPTLAYYLWTLKGTHELIPKDDRTSMFYSCTSIFAVQIAALPAMLIVALLVDPWVRFKVVFMSDALLRMIALFAMAILLLPGERSRKMLASGYEHIPTVGEDTEALSRAGKRAKSGIVDQLEMEEEDGL